MGLIFFLSPTEFLEHGAAMFGLALWSFCRLCAISAMLFPKKAPDFEVELDALI